MAVENLICNIWKQQCKIPVNKQERLCPNCNGRGGRLLNPSFKTRKFEIRKCPMCAGDGKVDWITAITKKPKLNLDGRLFQRDIKEIHMKCSGPNRCKKRLKRIWQQEKNFIDPYGPFSY